MRYAVVIERAKRNFSAYLPDVPGCVATGPTVDETLGRLRDALTLHLAGLREDGDPAPNPESSVSYIDVPIPSEASVIATITQAGKNALVVD